MIKKFFKTYFEVRRPSWTTDDESNQYSQMHTISQFYGHKQQASAELVQSLGLNFSKTFSVWCPLDTDVKEGDAVVLEKGNLITLVNEIQQLGFDMTPDVGTYTISFKGQTTDPIPWDSTAEYIEGELENLITVGEGNITVTGDIYGGTFTFEFINDLKEAPQELLVIDTALLTSGGSPVTAILAEQQAGGAQVVYQNEIMQITFSNTPNVGSISFFGEGYTTDVMYSNEITKDRLQQILAQIYGTNNIQVSYVNYDTYSLQDGFYIEFYNQYAEQTVPLFQIASDSLFYVFSLFPRLCRIKTAVTISEYQQGSGNGTQEHYVVRAVQANGDGLNKHLELTVELDEDTSDLGEGN